MYIVCEGHLNTCWVYLPFFPYFPTVAFWVVAEPLTATAPPGPSTQRSHVLCPTAAPVEAAAVSRTQTLTSWPMNNGAMLR